MREHLANQPAPAEQSSCSRPVTVAGQVSRSRPLPLERVPSGTNSRGRGRGEEPGTQRRGSVQLEQATAQRLGDGGRARVDTELGVGAQQMGLDGGLGDVELGTDLAVGQSA